MSCLVSTLMHRCALCLSRPRSSIAWHDGVPDSADTDNASFVGSLRLFEAKSASRLNHYSG